MFHQKKEAMKKFQTNGRRSKNKGGGGGSGGSG